MAPPEAGADVITGNTEAVRNALYYAVMRNDFQPQRRQVYSADQLYPSLWDG